MPGKFTVKKEDGVNLIIKALKQFSPNAAELEANGVIGSQLKYALNCFINNPPDKEYINVMILIFKLLGYNDSLVPDGVIRNELRFAINVFLDCN
ncbi:MAG: hypothetical protein V3T98_00490 [Candidatus Paceibacterota bacterium]